MFFIGLSRSHDLDRRLVRLTLFLKKQIDFFSITSFNIRLIENWFFFYDLFWFAFLYIYPNFITQTWQIKLSWLVLIFFVIFFWILFSISSFNYELIKTWTLFFLYASIGLSQSHDLRHELDKLTQVDTNQSNMLSS